MNEQFQLPLVRRLFNQGARRNLSLGKLLTVKKLAGDASSRQYFRLVSTKQSYVCAIEAKPNQERKGQFQNIQQLFKKLGILCPEIYDEDFSVGYVLQQDLGEQTLHSWLGTWQDRRQISFFYQQAISSILLLHRSKKDLKPLDVSFKEEFNLEFYLSEIDVTKNFYLESFLGKKSQASMNKLRNCFAEFFAPLENHKRVAIHRDFHSRNLMIHQKKCYTIDFQDTRWGIGAYDSL